jgi:sulfur relay (sulfurtransferase) DsrC/TusE family protein
MDSERRRSAEVTWGYPAAGRAAASVSALALTRSNVRGRRGRSAPFLNARYETGEDRPAVISIAAMRTRDLEPEHVWMAAWVEDVAGQYGQVEAIERVAAAMSERVGEDLLSLQWLMRGFLKAARWPSGWPRTSCPSASSQRRR